VGRGKGGALTSDGVLDGCSVCKVHEREVLPLDGLEGPGVDNFRDFATHPEDLVQSGRRGHDHTHGGSRGGDQVISRKRSREAAGTRLAAQREGRSGLR
jgi:hypothetical protein